MRPCCLARGSVANEAQNNSVITRINEGRAAKLTQKARVFLSLINPKQCYLNEHTSIRNGSISLAFRKRPAAKSGSKIKTAIGLVSAVTVVKENEITMQDAASADLVALTVC